jgi:NADP-dependent 3-hydroxy acid dehydrogenase YdfG
MTKFGVNGFTEALRQQVAKRQIRVRVVEPSGAETELGSHNSGAMVEQILKFYETTGALQAEDIADGVACMVTRPHRPSVSELWIMPIDQA